MTDGNIRLFQRRVNVVVVGDGGCGKTSLLYVFSRNEFPEQYLPTVFETSVTDVNVNGRTVELQLWDTAGQEEYDRLRPLSYMDADVIIICYSVSNPDSYNNVFERWLPEVRHFCPGRPIVLAANKTDLRPTDQDVTSSDTGNDVAVTSRSRYVTTEQGKNMAEQIGALGWMECSAKTRHGVNDVFLTAAHTAVNRRRHRHKHSNCTVL